MVRLSFNQVMTTIRAILGATIADKIANDPVYAADLPDAKHRWFPPLASPREGSVITDAAWNTGDQIAQTTAQYVFDNFATVTKCTQTGTALDTCAQTWLRSLAASAWRRPLTRRRDDVLQPALHRPERRDQGRSHVPAGHAVQRLRHPGSAAVPLPHRVRLVVDRGRDAVAVRARERAVLLPDRRSARRDVAVGGGEQRAVDRRPDRRAGRSHPGDAGGAHQPARGDVRLLRHPQHRGGGHRHQRLHDLERRLAQLDGARDRSVPAGHAVERQGHRPADVEDVLHQPHAGVVLRIGDARAGHGGHRRLRQGHASRHARRHPDPGRLPGRARPSHGGVGRRARPAGERRLPVREQPGVPVAAGRHDQHGQHDARRPDRAREVRLPAHDRAVHEAATRTSTPTAWRWRTTTASAAIARSTTRVGPSTPRSRCRRSPAGRRSTAASSWEQALASGGAFANCIAKNLVNFALAETPAMPVETNACAIRNVSDAFTASSNGTFSSLVRGVAISTTLASRTGGLP